MLGLLTVDCRGLTGHIDVGSVSYSVIDFVKTIYLSKFHFQNRKGNNK